MKKNGFTLVELLAVIVILSLLIVIAVPSVTKMSRKIQTNMFCDKVKDIEKAAELWGIDNEELVYSSENVTAFNYEKGENVVYQHAKMITVRELVKKGYQKSDDKDKSTVDPRDDSDLLDKKVLVLIKSKRPYATYQYDNEDDYNACKE
ncbi:MAG: competence type IV pilus major pilin ComGC [Bacilli bacterium]